MKFTFALGMALIVSSPGWAERAAVQVGDHRNLGRVVISLGSTAPATVRQRGTRIDIAVAADDDVVAPDTVPRNVLSIIGARGSARLTVLSGARVKSKQEGRTLLVDILDPATRSRDAALTAGSRPNPGKPIAAPESQQAAAPVVTVATPTVHSAADATPSPSAPAELSPAAAPTAPASPPRPVIRAYTVKAGPETGAAAFKRDDMGVVVFDGEVTLADTSDSESTVTPKATAIQHGTMMDRAAGGRRGVDHDPVG